MAISSGTGVPSLRANAAASMFARTMAFVPSDSATAATASDNGSVALGSRRVSTSLGVSRGVAVDGALRADGGWYCRCA